MVRLLKVFRSSTSQMMGSESTIREIYKVFQGD